MTETVYDCAVIGTGQGGKPLALELASAGRKTLVIERSHVGGTCVNRGCTPTKTMVASARMAHLSRRAADWGVISEFEGVDFDRVKERKESVVEMFRQSGRKGLEEAENLDFFQGEARFVDQKTLTVTDNSGGASRIRAEQIFINSGTRPRVPAILGLDQIDFLDSTSIMELDLVPDRLGIIGGGYIGVEFGQMFQRFGSQVMLIQRGPQILNREDEDVAEALIDILGKEGVQILLNREPVEVDQGQQGISLLLRDQKGNERFQVDQLLIAAGRIPNSDTLDLEKAGVDTDERGYIRVNGRLETSEDGIYALGDVKGGPAFTHVSYDDFRILRDNLLGKEERGVDDRLVPYTVFTDPELGRVGLSEKEAKRQGLDFRVATLPMTHAARAIEKDETRGFMKALVGDDDQILGCAMLGVEGGELMSMIQIAMMGNLPFSALRDGVLAHPTLAESLNNLFAGID